MNEWYGLNDTEYEKLIKSGITTLDFIKSIPLFKAEDSPVSVLNLLLYLDQFGSESPTTHGLIFKAVYNSLPVNEQIDVIHYIEWLEEENED